MFAAARRSLAYLTPGERTRYIVFVTLRSLIGLLDVFGILLIGLIASIAASSLGSGGSGAVILGIQLPALTATDLLWLVIFVLGVFVGKTLLAILLIRRMTLFIARVETRNARAIAEMVMSGSLDSVKAYSKAQLQYAVANSTTSVFSGVLNNVATMISEGFLLLVVVASFFLVNPVAAIATLVFFAIVVALIQFVIGSSIRTAGRDAASGLVDTTNTVSDTMDGFREISVLGKQELFLDRLAASRARLSGSAAMFAFLGGMPRYVVETSLILGIVLFVGVQFLTGGLEDGIVTIGVFLTGGVRIMASLLPLQAAFTAIKQNTHQGELAVELLDRQRSLAAESDAAAVRAAAAPAVVPADLDADHALPVTIRDVSFRYPGADADTLHDISVSFDAGSYVAIIGPSGAGKTTLVDLILGLVAPATGAVEIAGVAPVALRAIAPGRVAYVPQKPGMVTGTIAENIALGVPVDEIDRDRVVAAVESAYLSEFIATLPDGIDTSVGAQVDALSGGQIQRIGLARALYAQPRLLILDEATSGLDASSEAFIAETLRGLHHDVTVVVIAHRLSTVQHADVVHVVQAGRVVASGGFAELRRTVPMVEEYVKLMSFDDPAAPES